MAVDFLLDQPLVARATTLAILLHADHLDDLPPPGDEFAKPLRLGPREAMGRAGGPPPALREQGDDLRVDRIGLGEPAERAGEISDLARD